MRKFYYGVLVALLLQALPYITKAQTTSNSGTEFWAVFPTHEPDFDQNFNLLQANYSVFVTATQASSGTVRVGSFTQNFSVAANAVVEVQVPRSAAYIDVNHANTVVTDRAIHVTVDPGQPKVVVYAHIFAGQRSAASLILPREALGKQYFSVNFPQYNNEGKNYIAIVATEPNTKVRIKKGNIDLVPGGVTLAHVNDVYEYLSDNDLTGVSVSVDPSSSLCSRFAMFCGSSGVRIGTGNCNPTSLDPLFQQAYAVENWGLNYGFIPFSMESPNNVAPVRTAGQYATIIARDNNTQVSINGSVVSTLNSGEFFITPQPLRDATAITADKPIGVAQFAISQACSNLNGVVSPNTKSFSDPDMVILNPIDYSIKNITTYSSSREQIAEQYLNILIKTQAAASFRINNATPLTQFKQFAALPGFSYLQLNLNSYTGHTFTLAADDGFNAIAYGFGNVESYAYSAGTTLSATQSLSGISASTQQVIDSACASENYFFKLTLPYQPAYISWKMDAAEQATVQQNPTGTAIVLNGKTVYEYSFPKTAAYNNAGVHFATVISAYPQIGNCNAGVQQIDYLFKVKAVPSISIGAVAESCMNVIDFAGVANSGSNIASWEWNFGDTDPLTNSSFEQNPVHAYTKNGTYTVSLTVVETNGCQNTTTRTVNIATTAAYPNVFFSPLGQVCTNTTPYYIIAARETTGSQGNGIYYGDGINAAGFFNPSAAGAGTHQITYQFTSASGCVVTQTQSLTVLQSPFVADTVFYVFKGKPLTLIPRYGSGNLVYHWMPSTGLNNPSSAMPTATLYASTDYQLTVSNGQCEHTGNIRITILLTPMAVNTFTPNGDGVNDFWQIEHISEFPQAKVDVFNRYGTPVYHSAGYQKPWDGRCKGLPVPAGVYYYIINPGRKETPVISGSVTVIR